MLAQMGSHTATSSREIMPEGIEGRAIAAEPIDLKHLGRFTYGDYGDEGLESEVLDLFAGQLPVTIAALSGATTEREWLVAAHTLKGSCRAVGAWKLEELALQAERVPSLDDRTGRAAILRLIDAAAADAGRFITALQIARAR